MRHLGSTWLFPFIGLSLSCISVLVRGMTDVRREELRDETAALFKHGYEGYMRYAYPADELRPLSCGPLGRDPNEGNFGINDIHANISMTLVDVLSSLPVVHPKAYPKAVQLVAERVSFDQDVKVQVFEMTIRALGALLSTWGGARKASVNLKQYKDRMLALAKDLGERLLPAFDTVTGIPYARVNLRSGVLKGESVETCTAGAGSLLLEFALLSRLTGDDRFESLAHNAYMAIWNRRTQQNLLGNTIGTHGHWLPPGFSGVGAGMDSFFEYGIKAGIMLDDDTYYDIFYDSYAAVQTHVRTPDGFIYRPIQIRLLQPSSPSTIDSLSAFLPGIQVLAGDVESAIKSHLVFWNLWRKHSAMPESWQWSERNVEWAGYPGRPEFIESTYYLYQATQDPFYLRVGERILSDLKRRTKTKCGFATLKNVMTGELEDRMESFMLSETLKYLYLLFADIPLPNANKVFTTEGHSLRVPPKHLRTPSLTRRTLRRGEHPTCPVYKPVMVGGLTEDEGIVVGIEGRAEYEYARSLIYGWGSEGLEAEDPSKMWWNGGVCHIPSAPKFAFEIVLSPLNTSDPSQVPPEDPSPGPNKVTQDSLTGDYVITDIEGLRLGVRWRFDGQGYDVSNIGPHRLRPGQQVIITDPTMRDHLPVASPPPSELSHSPAELILRFTAYPSDTAFVGQASGEGQVFLHAVGATAVFGKDFGAPLVKNGGEKKGWELGGKGMRLVIAPDANGQAEEGCQSLPRKYLGLSPEEDYVLAVARGNCTFLEKAILAKANGAAGVLVLGTPPVTDTDGNTWDEGLIRPSAEIDPALESELDDMGMIYTEYLVGEVLRRAVNVEKRVLGIELLRMDGDAVPDENGGRVAGAPAGGGKAGSGAPDDGVEAREGRLMVGQHAIHNLKVVNGDKIDRGGRRPP
ncbi:hypothetical protein I317_04461 [Kwoniella heveanensis CBS 569]|nr:hypothetical protein I317_04461 [Kwoniella heveanensis CBS 569]